MSSSSEIADLLETQTYNPAIVPQLESNLHLQISSPTQNPYSFQANRTLVKLYQFFPSMVNTENLMLAEMLALVYGYDCQEGNVDCGALGCLISEKVKKEDPFPELLRCADLFDSCQFVEFWSAYKSLANNSKVEKITELATSTHGIMALQRSILTMLSYTYKSTPVDHVLAQLDLQNVEELRAFVQAHTNGIVESVEGGNIIFKSNSENTKREKVNKKEGSAVDYGLIHGLIRSTE